jgi:UDP-glucuronate 4-epimerase
LTTFFAVRVLVTGAAGFIGSHVSAALLDRGDEVIGFDNLNPYYDPALKQARLDRLEARDGFRMVRGDLIDAAAVGAAFDGSPDGPVDRVVHLAAQAGVRYSLTNPHAYVDSNVTGTLNVLEACRHRGTEHLVFASSSSVYGANTAMPFSVHHNVDHPVSLYAATKKANELMAHSYSHLYRLPATGLRFFTVYGPWGRPDMAAFLFTRAILEGRPIDVFNRGDMRRDFTYIDDIVEGVVRVLDRVPVPDGSWTGDAPDPATSAAPYRLYNIGNNSPVELMDLIGAIEKALGRQAELNLLPMQPGDVPATYADVDDLVRDVGFSPATPIDVGIDRFVSWYREYFGV